MSTGPAQSPRSEEASGSTHIEDAPHAILAEDHESDAKPDGQDAKDVLEPARNNGKDETSNAANASNDAPSVPPLSKNQLKKLKRKREWEEGREDRKAKRREKNQERRERKRLSREEQAAQGILPDPNQGRKRLVKVPVTIVIDCGFEDLMADREQISLSNQVTRCYSDTRKAPFKPHMVISSFTGKLKTRYETVLNHCHQSWHGVSLCEGDFVQAAEEARVRMAEDKSLRLDGALQKGLAEDGPGSGESETQQADADVETDTKDRGEVVYLSSEATETLHELKPYSTYIIGGLVDKNRHKGVCHKRAQDRKIRTAKLPIGDYLKMDSRQVLATNHVNEIMVRWLELGDWGQAFMQVIPRRKGGVLNQKDGAIAEAAAGAVGDDAEVATSISVEAEDGADDEDGDGVEHEHEAVHDVDEHRDGANSADEGRAEAADGAGDAEEGRAEPAEVAEGAGND